MAFEANSDMAVMPSKKDSRAKICRLLEFTYKPFIFDSNWSTWPLQGYNVSIHRHSMDSYWATSSPDICEDVNCNLDRGLEMELEAECKEALREGNTKEILEGQEDSQESTVGYC